ncbi:hypothetical protein GS502_11155 [Rhodococcus hoagii]|nr:hypothetical protein [Prescottella equi]
MNAPEHPHDWGRMGVEVVKHSQRGDLIARTVETRLHLVIAPLASQPQSRLCDPEYLRLQADALLVLASTIETGGQP